MNLTMAGPGEPLSREPSPDEVAIRKEANELPIPELSPEEREKIAQVWKFMKIFRRDLYGIFRPWWDALELREGDSTSYSHGVYRGWYAEHAKRLRMSESSVRCKLDTAKKWFADRLRALDSE